MEQGVCSSVIDLCPSAVSSVFAVHVAVTGNSRAHQHCLLSAQEPSMTSRRAVLPTRQHLGKARKCKRNVPTGRYRTSASTSGC